MDYLLQSPTGTPRWDPSRFVAVVNGAFDPLNSYLVEAIQTLPVVGEYTVLDDANRPDMIAAAIYNNDTTLWWLLMLYNGTWDYTEVSHYVRVPVGTVIKYFSLDDLERLYFTLRAKQIANPS